MDTVLRGPLREILNSRLLVDDDRALVGEKLQDGIVYRSAKLIVFLFICIGAFIYSLQVLLESNGYLGLCLALKTLFNVYIILGLYGLHNLFVPVVVRIATWQLGRVDFRYHQFIAQLRQNESALYGIQQQVGASNYVYASGSRKRCIEELRELINKAREYSCKIPSDTPLIEDFIEDDLRLLAKIDGEVLPEHLELKALKALWQFMYIQRSELLRNFAIFHHDECLRLSTEFGWWSVLHFSRASLIGFVRFAWSASRFNVHLEVAPGEQQHKNQLNKVEAQNERSKLITQLEFLLDRLHSDSVSTDQIAEALINIASSIERRSTPKVNKINLESRITEEQEDNNEEVDPGTQNDEYQVFEAIVGNDDGSQADEFEDEYSVDPLIECRHDLQAELKHVLVERRQKDQELGLNALAKRRNKTVEEVREELEQESSKPKQEESQTTRQSNPTSMIDQNELLSALRNRFNNQKMETFGD